VRVLLTGRRFAGEGARAACAAGDLSAGNRAAAARWLTWCLSTPVYQPSAENQFDRRPTSRRPVSFNDLTRTIRRRQAILRRDNVPQHDIERLKPIQSLTWRNRLEVARINRREVHQMLRGWETLWRKRDVASLSLRNCCRQLSGHIRNMYLSL